MKPKGVLIDCGGTLLEEASHELRAGDTWLLANAARNPSKISLDRILERRAHIEKEVVVRRDQCQLETPWPVITRLIYDHFDIQFDSDWATLELEFWKVAMTTHAMPGAEKALAELQRQGIPVGVLSNSIYRPAVLLYELEKQGLSRSLQFVMSSAEHGVRKPDPILFELAAVKLGRQAADIWFVGDKLEIDVKGAEAAGMAPIWFHPPALTTWPYAGVSGWTDFVKLWHEA